jgi:hypothetical protein
MTAIDLFDNQPGCWAGLREALAADIFFGPAVFGVFDPSVWLYLLDD